MDDARAPAATPEQIKQMVDRFLSWPLPADFNPDGGITFTPEYQNPVGPARHEPTGTNLLTAAQATAMVENMLAAIDRLAAPEGVGLTRYGLDYSSRKMEPTGNGEWVRHEDAAAALAAKEYELKRFHEARANAPDYEVLWAEQAERAEVAEAERDALKAALPWPTGPFAFGDRVEKVKGSSWHGTVCGWYSTSLTPTGYCVESEREPGSVQLYPAAALSKTQGGG